MAKKKTARKTRPASAEPAHKFDDEKYEGLRFSATYDYGELALSKAASYLGGQKARIASFAVSMACLALMAHCRRQQPGACHRASGAFHDGHGGLHQLAQHAASVRAQQ